LIFTHKILPYLCGVMFCVLAIVSPASAQQAATAATPNSNPKNLPWAGVKGITAPTCIYCPQPGYTKQARKVNFNGIVLFVVTVTSDGRVIDPVAIKDPGLGLAEQSVQKFVKWKMNPCIGPDGHPVDCRVQIEVTFRRY
jgi:putative hemolysin